MTRKISRPPGRSSRAASGIQRYGSHQMLAPYSEIARSKLASAKRHLLGVAVEEREPQPELVLQPPGRGQLRRGVVDPDRPRAAPGQPGRDVPGAAAQLDGVQAVQVRRGAATWDSGTPQMPQAGSSAAHSRRPAPRSRSPTGPTRRGCAAHDREARSSARAREDRRVGQGLRAQWRSVPPAAMAARRTPARKRRSRRGRAHLRDWLRAARARAAPPRPARAWASSALGVFFAFVLYFGWDGGRGGPAGRRRPAAACSAQVAYAVPVALVGGGRGARPAPRAAGRAARSARARCACSRRLTLGFAAGTLGLGPDAVHHDIWRPRRRSRPRGGVVGEALYWATSHALPVVGAHILALFLLSRPRCCSPAPRWPACCAPPAPAFADDHRASCATRRVDPVRRAPADGRRPSPTGEAVVVRRDARGGPGARWPRSAIRTCSRRTDAERAEDDRARGAGRRAEPIEPRGGPSRTAEGVTAATGAAAT